MNYQIVFNGDLGDKVKKIDFEKNNLFCKCQFVTVQELLAGKWSILIFHELSSGAKRFNELRKQIGIAHSTLSQQLKFMEYEGLVHREVYPTVPPQVEYSLTEIGKSFQPVLDSIETFGKEYIEYIKRRNLEL